MFKNFFEGWYFKHQNDKNTLSFISGISKDSAFIQVITDQNSYNVNFNKNQFSKNKIIKIDKNKFSFNGISIDIEKPNLKIKGKINYRDLIPLKTDIMGFFKYFPMQCRHGIISMYHNLSGFMNINDEHFNFNNGTGYIESDSGYSFPKRYLWVQSNDFNEKCSVMLAIADIPFLGFHFEGLICSIYYKDKEYRMATYNGSKIIKSNQKKIEISNKNLRLEVCIPNYRTHDLYAPVRGKMTNIIKESPSCYAEFKLFENDSLIFNLKSNKTSCEFVDY